MSEHFKYNIKEWVGLDNEIKELNERIKVLRNKKTEINSNIIEYVDTNNLTSATIQISDGRLRFQNINSSTPLTFRYIQQCLSELISNDDRVNEIVQYIKDKREIRTNIDIKRIYN